MKQTPTVFIVDSDPAVLTTLEAVLKANGYAVQCYTSAMDFVAEQDDPNQAGCLLINLLTNANGSKLLLWLHESGSLLSIVLISGLIDPAEFVQKRDGTAPAVEKPYRVSALLTMVSDGVAGSLSRKAVRDRGRSKG